MCRDGSAAYAEAIRHGASKALRTRAPHAAVHDLLGQGVGLLDCSRRLGWGLNTVKRYAGTSAPSPVNTSSFDHVTRRNRLPASVGKLRQEHIAGRIWREVLNCLGAAFVGTY